MHNWPKIIEEENNPYCGLSRIVAHKLLNLNICSKEQVIAMIKEGTLHPANRDMKNFGWSSYVECCVWAGFPKPDRHLYRKIMICPHCMKPIP